MAKRPKKTNRNTFPRRAGRTKRATKEPGPTEQLQLGTWLRALGREQTEVAVAAGYGKSYINNMINPKKGKKPGKPSALAMLRVSRVLGVTVNDLYELPPTPKELDRLRRFQPKTVGSLMDVGN